MVHQEYQGWPETLTEMAEPEEWPTAADSPVVLRRDTGKNPGGGICAGIAKYLQIDVIFVRLAFVFLTIGSGIGLLLYILAYMLIPRATKEDRVSFALGSVQLRTARLAALLGTIALGLVAAAITLIPNFTVENTAPLILVFISVVVLVIWRLRR